MDGKTNAFWERKEYKGFSIARGSGSIESPALVGTIALAEVLTHPAAALLRHQPKGAVTSHTALPDDPVQVPGLPLHQVPSDT